MEQKIWHFLDFVASEVDCCEYIGHVRQIKVILLLYVDNGLLMAAKMVVLRSVLEVFKNEFKVTEGDGQYFVKLEVKRNSGDKGSFC